MAASLQSLLLALQLDVSAECLHASGTKASGREDSFGKEEEDKEEEEDSVSRQF